MRRSIAVGRERSHLARRQLAAPGLSHTRTDDFDASSGSLRTHRGPRPTMTRARRVRALLLLLGLVVAVQSGRMLYRWFVHGEERVQLAAMRERVVDAGVEVLRTQARADTLRRLIDQEDEALEAQRHRLERYGGYARDGGLDAQLYRAYRAELDAYNRRVRERNHQAEEWTEEVLRNQEAIIRYNQLADSIRALAGSIGDPYFPIPLPVEAAAERGLIPAAP